MRLSEPSAHCFGHVQMQALNQGTISSQLFHNDMPKSYQEQPQQWCCQTHRRCQWPTSWVGAAPQSSHLQTQLTSPYTWCAGFRFLLPRHTWARVRLLEAQSTDFETEQLLFSADLERKLFWRQLMVGFFAVTFSQKYLQCRMWLLWSRVVDHLMHPRRTLQSPSPTGAVGKWLSTELQRKGNNYQAACIWEKINTNSDLLSVVNSKMLLYSLWPGWHCPWCLEEEISSCPLDHCTTPGTKGLQDTVLCWLLCRCCSKRWSAMDKKLDKRINGTARCVFWKSIPKCTREREMKAAERVSWKVALQVAPKGPFHSTFAQKNFAHGKWTSHLSLYILLVNFFEKANFAPTRIVETPCRHKTCRCFLNFFAFRRGVRVCAVSVSQVRRNLQLNNLLWRALWMYYFHLNCEKRIQQMWGPYPVVEILSVCEYHGACCNGRNDAGWFYESELRPRTSWMSVLVCNIFLFRGGVFWFLTWHVHNSLKLSCLRDLTAQDKFQSHH